MYIIPVCLQFTVLIRICESMWTSLGVSVLVDECTTKIRIDVTHLGSFNDDCASRGQQSSVVIEIKLPVFEPQSLLNSLY